MPERWSEIRRTLEELQSAKRETIDHLADLLGDGKSPLAGKIKKYGNWFGVNDPRELAEFYVESISELNKIAWELLSSGGGVTVERKLEEIASKQESVVERVRRGDSSSSTQLLDPEGIAKIASGQMEFYRSMVAQTTPEDFYRRFFNYKPKSLEELGMGGMRALSLGSGETAKTIKETPLSRIRANIEKRREELGVKATSLKEQVSDKVESEWTSDKVRAFESEVGRENITEIEQIIERQRNAEILLPQLDFAISGLRGRMNENVDLLSGGNMSFNIENIRRINDEIDGVKDQIKENEAIIRGIEERGRDEGDGLFGGKRKQRESEIAPIKAEIKALEGSLLSLEEELKSQKDDDKKLEGLSGWIGDSTRKLGLKLGEGERKFTLQELVDNIKGQTNFKLTAQQREIYMQYQSLAKEKGQASDEYRKKWGGR